MVSQADRVEESVEEPTLAREDEAWLSSVLAEYHENLAYLRDH
jgi:hypothetical protein